MDRAWGEFRLRDRITSDALKFHRRLRHWKEQVDTLQCSLQNATNDHEQEVRNQQQRHQKELDAAHEEMAQCQKKMEEYQLEADAVQQDLVEYKTQMESTFKLTVTELCDAKERVTELETEIKDIKETGDRFSQLERELKGVLVSGGTSSSKCYWWGCQKNRWHNNKFLTSK